MKGQKRQMVVLLLLLGLMLAVYAGIRFYNQKQEEKEKAAEDTIKVTQLDSAEITEFSFISEGKVLSFSKEEEEWICEKDSSVKLEESMIQAMLDTAAGLEAKEEIMEYDELSEYGLTKPQNTIILKTAEDTITLYLGNQNEIAGGYYLKREDSDTVYLVDSGISDNFSYTLEEMTAEE